MGVNDRSIWSYIRERSSDPRLLRRTAVIDCTRQYSYAQMFDEWERYARVFSALGMTEENAARVGVAGTISAEPLFAFYGLNMTGASVSMLSYPDFLPGGQWRAMAQRERLTDLVLSDIIITPELWPALQQAKAELGLRNIILLHSQLGGPCAGPAELVYDELNRQMLRRLPGVVYMDDLLKRYADAPVRCGSGDPEHLAIITHASGTTKGTRKPLPFTDRAVNTVAGNFGSVFRFLAGEEGEQFRLAPSFDFSSFLCMCGIINASFAGSNCVVLTFFGFMHPKFVRAVGYHRINVLFTSGFMFDSWMKRPDTDDIDFSPVKILSCGGSYLPPDKLARYEQFARSHGYKGHIWRGYGMSETGGAQLTVPDGCMDDILGFPNPKEDFVIQDENDGKYYTADDGVRTGVMYVASDSLCENELDGERLFDYTVIGGRNFICTNDLVRVNPDGSFSYAGRADRFFVNNDGVRFDAGAAETELSRQPGIEKCAVVPVFDKRIHDTVPALYIVPDAPGSGASETVRQALKNVYVAGGKLGTDVLPSQFILVDDIPCNSNGKLDIYRITRDRLKGAAWNIVPVRSGGALTDILAEPAGQTDSITGGTLPEGMDGRSALGLYELFNAPPGKKRTAGLCCPLGLIRDAWAKSRNVFLK